MSNFTKMNENQYMRISYKDNISYCGSLRVEYSILEKVLGSPTFEYDEFESDSDGKVKMSWAFKKNNVIVHIYDFRSGYDVDEIKELDFNDWHVGCTYGKDDEVFKFLVDTFEDVGLTVTAKKKDSMNFEILVSAPAEKL